MTNTPSRKRESTEQNSKRITRNMLEKLHMKTVSHRTIAATWMNESFPLRHVLRWYTQNIRPHFITLAFSLCFWSHIQFNINSRHIARSFVNCVAIVKSGVQLLIFHWFVMLCIEGDLSAWKENQNKIKKFKSKRLFFYWSVSLKKWFKNFPNRRTIFFKFKF